MATSADVQGSAHRTAVGVAALAAQDRTPDMQLLVSLYLRGAAEEGLSTADALIVLLNSQIGLSVAVANMHEDAASYFEEMANLMAVRT